LGPNGEKSTGSKWKGQEERRSWGFFKLFQKAGRPTPLWGEGGGGPNTRKRETRQQREKKMGKSSLVVGGGKGKEKTFAAKKEESFDGRAAAKGSKATFSSKE